MFQYDRVLNISSTTSDGVVRGASGFGGRFAGPVGYRVTRCPWAAGGHPRGAAFRNLGGTGWGCGAMLWRARSGER